jgi:hypothetical protein
MSGEGPMHEVLISYSKKDKLWADAACAALEAHGIRCWIAPRDIMPGTEWGASIIAGIDGCKVMVVIFSASANESPQVRREVERAISKELTVVPCRVEDVRPVGAMEYALGNTHWLDVFTPPVERQMKRLAESVRALLPPDRGAPKIADGRPVVPVSAGRKESRRESRIPTRNGRGKQKLGAAGGFALFLLVAVCLAVVFWPRKEPASTLKNADSVTAGETASPANSPAAATSATPAPPRPPGNAIDPFQTDSIWFRNKPRSVLTVTERKGAIFQARFEVGPHITRLVNGTVKDGKVDWFAKDSVAIKGGVGDDNHGTITRDEFGYKIDFVYGVEGNRKGQFTLRLQK